MQMLLCAATEKEILPTIQFLKAGNYPIKILITGVGLPSAIYALTKYVSTHKPDFILQAGIAGYLSNQLSLGNVVTVQHETIGDLGVMEKQGFQSLFDMGFTGRNEPPWVNGQLANPSKELWHCGLPVVDGVTVNEITTAVDRINYYRHQLKAIIETMEGAALHYIAGIENIPFLQLRSLSNFVGERDKAKWNLPVALASLNQELQRWIKNYFTV